MTNDPNQSTPQPDIPQAYQPQPTTFQQPPQFQQAPAAQSVDLQKAISGFKMPEWLIVGGSLAFVIASFLPWYAASYTFKGALGIAASDTSTSANAWNWFPGVLAALLAIATIGFFAARLYNIALPALPAPDRVIYMALGGAIAFFSLIELTQFPHIDTGGLSSIYGSFSAGPSFGLFLGLIASVAIIAGGYMRRA